MSGQTDADWLRSMRSLMAHLRANGWTRPFIMRGTFLIAPGMIVTPDFLMPDFIAHNEN